MFKIIIYTIFFIPFFFNIGCSEHKAPAGEADIVMNKLLCGLDYPYWNLGDKLHSITSNVKIRIIDEDIGYGSYQDSTISKYIKDTLLINKVACIKSTYFYFKDSTLNSIYIKIDPIYNQFGEIKKHLLANFETCYEDTNIKMMTTDTIKDFKVAYNDNSQLNITSLYNRDKNDTILIFLLKYKENSNVSTW